MAKTYEVKQLVNVGIVAAFATLAFVGTTVIRIPIPATGGLPGRARAALPSDRSGADRARTAGPPSVPRINLTQAVGVRRTGAGSIPTVYPINVLKKGHNSVIYVLKWEKSGFLVMFGLI